MKKRLWGFLADSLKYNWPAYFMVLTVFAAGLAAGFSGVDSLQADQVRELGQYLDRFLQQAGVIEVDKTKAIRQVFYNDILVIAALYILGLTIIGIPIMLGVVFTRGFVLGFAIGFLAKGKGLPGIIFACAAVIPQNIFFVPALLLGGVASLSFALLLVRRFFNSKTVVWPSFVLFSCFMLMVTVFSCAAGLVEVYLTPVLIKLAANMFFN